MWTTSCDGVVFEFDGSNSALEVILLHEAFCIDDTTAYVICVDAEPSHVFALRYEVCLMSLGFLIIVLGKFSSQGWLHS